MDQSQSCLDTPRLHTRMAVWIDCRLNSLFAASYALAMLAGLCSIMAVTQNTNLPFRIVLFAVLVTSLILFGLLWLRSVLRARIVTAHYVNAACQSLRPSEQGYFSDLMELQLSAGAKITGWAIITAISEAETKAHSDETRLNDHDFRIMHAILEHCRDRGSRRVREARHHFND